MIHGFIQINLLNPAHGEKNSLRVYLSLCLELKLKNFQLADVNTAHGHPGGIELIQTAP